MAARVGCERASGARAVFTDFLRAPWFGACASTQHEDLKRQLEATPKDADAIDWAHYAGVIRTPGVVDLFKTAHSGLKLPTIDTTASIAAIVESEKAMIKLAEEATKEAEHHLAVLQKQLKELETAKSVDDLTVRPRLLEEMGFWTDGGRV